MPANLQIAVTAWMFGSRGLASDFATQGEIAEAMGFHSFWLPESHFGDEQSIPSPLMLLAAVAAKTSRIRLGSTSYLLPIRHPLQAAEEVAVLDRLSGGRLILGVGRGVQDAMFAAFDIKTRDKRKRFAENLASMINAWQGLPVAEIDGAPIVLSPLPVQRPHPPIWVAAFGPLAIKQAGNLGLPYLASPVETLAKLDANYQRHGAFAKSAGHARVTVVPVMRTVFASNSRSRIDTVRQSLAQGVGHRMREQGDDVADWTIVGEPAYVKDKIVEYCEVLGMTHLIVRGRIPGVDHGEQVDNLQILAKIAGDISL